MPSLKMSLVSAVIFDYYETLALLPAASRERVFDELALRLGVELPPGEAYRHWRERTTRDTALRLRSHDRPPLDGERPPFISFREVWQHRFDELFRHWAVDAPPELGVEAYRSAHADAVLYPDALPVVGLLRGRYRLAVLSDADTDFLQPGIARHGLVLDAVVTSEEVGAYKPHISLFREVCGRLGVTPSEAVYIGDIPWADVAGARNAGLRAVWINRHGVRWPEDIEPPEAQIRSLTELPGLLP